MQMLAPRISACGWAVCDCLGRGRILVARGDVMLTKLHREKRCWLVFWAVSHVTGGDEDKWLVLM